MFVDQLMPVLCDHWDGACLGDVANKYSLYKVDWNLY